jgi:hypothetical protein
MYIGNQSVATAPIFYQQCSVNHAIVSMLTDLGSAAVQSQQTLFSGRARMSRSFSRSSRKAVFCAASSSLLHAAAAASASAELLSTAVATTGPANVNIIVRWFSDQVSTDETKLFQSAATT